MNSLGNDGGTLLDSAAPTEVVMSLHGPVSLALLSLLHTVPTLAADDAPPPPPAAAPAPGDAAAPADAPAPAAPAPADAPAPPPPALAAPCATLDSAEATRAYEACLALVVTSSNADDVHACFTGVARDFPDSLAATRAQASAKLLLIQKDAGRLAAPPLLPPGRLELVGVAGTFGVWNAVAGGIMFAETFPSTNGGAVLLGTSAAALGLGVGLGVGGYYVADAMELTEGDAQLVASGLVWGTHLGIPLAIFVLDAIKPERGYGSIALGTVVVSGWLGGAAALGATRAVELDAGQVALVNVTGAVGSFVGGMAVLNLGANGVSSVPVTTLTYTAGAAAGLGAGALLASNVSITWGEAQIAGLGAALGGTVLGLGTVGVLALSNVQGDAASLTALTTGAATLGVVGGYAGGLFVVSALRDARGEPLFRSPAKPAAAGAKPVALASRSLHVDVE